MPVVTRAEALAWAQRFAEDPLDGELLAAADAARDAGWGNLVTYSPKVFIPLTKLCRDVCHYCTFARPPIEGRRAYLSIDEVLDIARAGAAAGCREALFTLGDKPELRYRIARDELAAMGYATTVEYLTAAAKSVLEQTGLLPHINPGILSGDEIDHLRDVAPSMGIMLESTSPRLCEPGMPHHGSPDKDPAVRLAMLDEAGRRRVPCTTALLIGIGETWQDRAETLLAIRDAHERSGHIQEVIVQNFRAKPGTPMHDHPEPSTAEMLGTVALARLILGPDMSVQAPPNLAGSPDALAGYLGAGINDWGGVSPVTIDHVNPEAPGPEIEALAGAADDLRREICGDTVTFVVNRNINYTNMCYFRCGFCAFSKGPKSLNLRGDPYLLSLEDIATRTREAALKGATEVCLQGGIHPEFTGDFYLDVVKAVKSAVPSMHVHAFSPLEVWPGAATKGVSIRDFLWELKDAGLGSLPGTAAEVLDDEIRAIICPDKVNTAQWSEVARTAHGLGLPMTTTIMFGHVEGYRNWARHLGVLRDIQKDTGGFTEFVPLPFVHMGAPIYLKGRARQGPTFEEALKIHAVARLALHPWTTNIQVSWVKMGTAGLQLALKAGCNDMGGTLMNENISREGGGW